MARRYELTVEQFRLIEDLLPARGKPGGRWNDHHATLNGVFWWLYSGARWREMPMGLPCATAIQLAVNGPAFGLEPSFSAVALPLILDEEGSEIRSAAG